MQNFVSTNIVKQQELIDKSKLWNKFSLKDFQTNWNTKQMKQMQCTTAVCIKLG